MSLKECLISLKESIMIKKISNTENKNFVLTIVYKSHI